MDMTGFCGFLLYTYIICTACKCGRSADGPRHRRVESAGFLVRRMWLMRERASATRLKRGSCASVERVRPVWRYRSDGVLGQLRQQIGFNLLLYVSARAREMKKKILTKGWFEDVSGYGSS
jgi:hypothetical protein